MTKEYLNLPDEITLEDGYLDLPDEVSLDADGEHFINVPRQKYPFKERVEKHRRLW